jgi:hypothetical protein
MGVYACMAATAVPTTALLTMEMPSVAVCTVAIAINEWGEWEAIGSSRTTRYEMTEDARHLLKDGSNFISDNVQVHWVEVELPFPSVVKGMVISE